MRRATCKAGRSSETLTGLADEHPLAALCQPCLLGDGEEQAKRVVGDAVLGVVEVEAGSFRGEPLPPRGVRGEEFAQGRVLDRAVVADQPAPGGKLG